MLYCDGFSPKNARVLLQFILIPQNSPETIKSWEKDYRDILAYIESCKPPKYPWTVNSKQAEQGRTAFTNHCSRCHGTYGKNAKYEQKIVPIEDIGTDPVRLEALSVESRRKIQKSWMSHYGKDKVILDPGGYVPPPLDGIWASAPFSTWSWNGTASSPEPTVTATCVARRGRAFMLPAPRPGRRALMSRSRKPRPRQWLRWLT